ncbi:MAG: aminotransferase class, partial [Rhizobacter sp.]|nr:aminotransferase class [Rhizobacter sp.]
TRSAIVSFSLAHHDARTVNRRLFNAGINVSTSPQSSTLLDSIARGLPLLLRASPHYYNDDADLEMLVAAIREMN